MLPVGFFRSGQWRTRTRFPYSTTIFVAKMILSKSYWLSSSLLFRDPNLSHDALVEYSSYLFFLANLISMMRSIFCSADDSQ